MFSVFVEHSANNVLHSDSSDILWRQIIKTSRSDYILKDNDEWTSNTVGFVYVSRDEYLKEHGEENLNPDTQTQYFLGVLDNYNAAINGYI